jgi:hypothetical protein
MNFSQVPIRTYGVTDPSWWNSLRAAGVSLMNLLGGGYIEETSFAIANNNATPANVTGLSVASASYKGALVMASIRRYTDSSEVSAIGFLHLSYRVKSSTWDLTPDLPGDATGVTFSITAAGQVQYVSDNLAGANYYGNMNFKLLSFTN